ncbi:hypothetical protein BCR41DRAFT_345440 [Lobosporangium transversale]|uniref:Uncharacterized protein n=1 Tax=Lobosporangium transversale TaxID=64571 RepID=A0A1Y2H617_9FUNG|nr:hypothetical protein BCR41DRAFT_345440 [Lobosporangium transversale]ORZ28502.1 hypothetical protein BCR41DRAFT_345440 [Lobosporangium transversale]|eukprot:XP_021886187.1 hypothetical protein BCR41DRAFT_345440 [Lobosporangium transversale]
MTIAIVFSVSVHYLVQVPLPLILVSPPFLSKKRRGALANRDMGEKSTIAITSSLLPPILNPYRFIVSRMKAHCKYKDTCSSF